LSLDLKTEIEGALLKGQFTLKLVLDMF